jgi:hypothetical protein
MQRLMSPAVAALAITSPPGVAFGSVVEGPPVSAAGSAAEWRPFMRDAPHTGLNATEIGAITADTLALRWSTRVADPGSRAATGPVVAMVGGRRAVFVAVCKGGNGCVADVPGRVLALDGATGAGPGTRPCLGRRSRIRTSRCSPTWMPTTPARSSSGRTRGAERPGPECGQSTAPRGARRASPSPRRADPSTPRG